MSANWFSIITLNLLGTLFRFSSYDHFKKLMSLVIFIPRIYFVIFKFFITNLLAHAINMLSTYGSKIIQKLPRLFTEQQWSPRHFLKPLLLIKISKFLYHYSGTCLRAYKPFRDQIPFSHFLVLQNLMAVSCKFLPPNYYKKRLSLRLFCSNSWINNNYHVFIIESNVKSSKFISSSNNHCSFSKFSSTTTESHIMTFIIMLSN